MVGSAKVLEWRTMWPIAMVAMLGVAGSGLYSMTSGVFMGELTHAFGWSKAQFTSSMTGQIMVNIVAVPLVGRAIDRFGTRAVALTGLVPAVLGMAVLGLADGTLWQWWMLCIVQGLTIALLLPPVWITGVVGNFRVSRGLAIAVALAGAGVGAAIWPALAAFYVERLGWRLAYGAVALTWGAVMIPITLGFFHGTKGGPTLRERRAPQPFAHILLSRTFLCLTVSGALFICVCYGMMLHLVPILRTGGLNLSTAALVAGIAGMFSIVGRLGTGFLLDIMPTRVFGVSVFLLPVAVSLLLHYCVGSFPLALVAVTILGLATGAESDILSYIAARRFDHAVFGSVYAVIQTVFAISAVAGSELAGTLFDIGGSYALFLNVIIPMTIIGAATLMFVPDQKPLNVSPDMKTDAAGSAFQEMPVL
jgi:MFS family permease